MYTAGASLTGMKAQAVRKSLSFRDKMLCRLKRLMGRYLPLTP